MAADSDANKPATMSVAERIAALQKANKASSNGNSPPPIGPSPTKPKRSALADRIAAFQNSPSTGRQVQVETGAKLEDGAADDTGKGSNDDAMEAIDGDDAACEDANATNNQEGGNEITPDIESGAAATAEDRDSEPISSNDNNDDILTEPKTTNEPCEDEINPTSNRPATEEQTSELNGEEEKGIGNTAAPGEGDLSVSKTMNSDVSPNDNDEYHDADVDEEPVLNDNGNVMSRRKMLLVLTEDVVTTPDPDDNNMNEGGEKSNDNVQTQPKEHEEVIASESNLIDVSNLDDTEEVPYEANAPSTLFDDSLRSLDVPVNNDQTDVIVAPDVNSGDAGKESDNVESQMKEQVGAVAVVGESIHDANTTHPEEEHSNPEDHANLSANETLLTLRRDEVAPVEIDEEMAGAPVNVDDKMEEAYPEDRRPTRGYKSYILVACIAVLAIIAAVVVTSMSRDSAQEPSSSSSSSTAITENGNGTDATDPPSAAPSSATSSLPSDVPSTKPSSQYEWLQFAIDNYVGMLNEASGEETTTPIVIPDSTFGSNIAAPSPAPTASSTPPPSTANPTTTKPTLSTATPTSRPTMNPSTANTTANPTPLPTTASPTMKPSTEPTANLSEQPPLNIAGVSFNETNPTQKPSLRPTPQQRKGCITNIIYDEIDRDIEQLKNGITDDETRAHFLGGIVRLVAHDFMDYDRNNSTHPMGPDGCFDPFHSANAGLPDDLWCHDCLLTNLYTEKYAARQISRADFWIACANAVIRQTSVHNGLNLRDTFEWGRVDSNVCPGSGPRLPSPRSCSQTENVFLTRMGLTWTDATALMGAHTLGRGEIGFSGHGGTWVTNNNEAQVFDKAYYEEVFLNSWRPRNIGTPTEDWTTGDGADRVMLNTDLCLVMEVEENMPCCTSTRCTGSGSGLSRCNRLPANHPRSEAFEAFQDYLGGSYPNDNQVPFYGAFREAWRKATKVGQNNLAPLADNC